MTEYLNREFEKLNTDKKVGYVYSQNVDFVELLHNVMGDSLIKAYLTGSSQAFEEEFSTYITDDGTSNIKALERFYGLLDRVHSVLHPNTEYKTDEEQRKQEASKRELAENVYPELRKIVVNIVANSVRKKARDLAYYENGVFNSDEVVKDIEGLAQRTFDLLSKNRTFGISNFGKEKLELYESILKKSLTAVLQESHISNEEIEHILNATIIGGDNTPLGKRAYTRLPNMNEWELSGYVIDMTDYSGPAKALMDKRFENRDAYMVNGQFNITAFLMDASLVLDKMGLEGGERQVYFDSAILRYLPPDIDCQFVRGMIDNHSKLFVALYQKQQDNKRNVVDSKFVKISDTKFIEKRDDKIFFLNFNESTGKFEEEEITGNNADRKMRFSKDVIGRFGGNVQRRTYEELGNRGQKIQYSILFNEDFSTVTVNGKSYEVLSSPEKVGDSFLIDEALKPVLGGIKKKRYVSILNDGEKPDENATYVGVVPDTRSRVINYALFLRELRSGLKYIPIELRKRTEESMIGRLISNTYLIKPEDMRELQLNISAISDVDLEDIADEQEAARLYSFTEKLNQSRRRYIEQQSRFTGVSFKSDDAKKRWEERLKDKEARKKDEKLEQDIRAFVLIEARSCIIEPLEERTSEDHYSEMEGIQYSREQKGVEYMTAAARKVDYEAFCDKLKNALDAVEEADREFFGNSIMADSMRMWQGCGFVNHPEWFRLDGEREELQGELTDFLINRINGSASINMTRVREIEVRLLELSRQEEILCQVMLEERKPAKFESADVEADYESIKSIHEMAGLPEEAKKAIIQGLKDKSRRTLQRKRTMDAFAKLALNGNRTPMPHEVDKASEVIDFYKDIDRD